MAEGTFVSVQGRGVIAIPAELRRRFGLDRPGAQVELAARDDGVIELRPHLAAPAEQSWIWTAEWQARIRDGLEDQQAGRSEMFEGGQDGSACT
ncbi:MAG: AbrB/MazE/SpoVT family DNA-binding domain-containing protein [Egibacteraceae bacterium]